jgi:CHAT domain-containing protein/tetratricopeptide (TPR) repeat protein
MYYISKEKNFNVCFFVWAILFWYLVTGLISSSAASNQSVAIATSGSTFFFAVREKSAGKTPGIYTRKKTRKANPTEELKTLSLLATGPTTGVLQNPLAEASLMAEGLKLLEQQTRQGIIKAIDKFREAFTLSQRNNIFAGMSFARLWEAIAYDLLGEYKEALQAALDALHYLEKGNLIFFKPLVYPVLGAIYAAIGETDNALHLLDMALRAEKEVNSPQFSAYIFKGFGAVNIRMGHKHLALENLTKALSFYKQVNDWRHQIEVLILISTLHSSLGQLPQALESAQAAITISKEKGASDAEAVGHFALGVAHATTGKSELAIKEYDLALELCRTQPGRFVEGTVLNNLGLIYYTHGELDRALTCFTKSLEIYQDITANTLAAYALNNIGTVYARRSEPLIALTYLEKALKLAQEHKDKRLQAAIFSSMANQYFSINNPEYAIRSLEQAAATLALIDEPGQEVEALINIADGYATIGNYKEALKVLRPIVDSQRLKNDPLHYGYALREMGYIYILMGDDDNAFKYFTDALSQLIASKDGIGLVDVYAALGSIYLQRGDYRKAEELYNQSLALAKSAGLRRGESIVLARLGFLKEQQGDLVQAEDYYNQHIKINESLLFSARVEEFKIEITNISAALAPQALRFKLKLGKDAEAFDLTERVRARAFLDQLNNVRINLQKGGNSKLLDEEQSLRLDIHSLEESLTKERLQNPLPETIQLLTENLAKQEQAYTSVVMRLKASNDEYANFLTHSPPSLQQIQQFLGPQTTMLSYFVTTNKTYAFIIRSNSLKVVEIPVTEADLCGQIKWFHSFPNISNDAQPGSLVQLNAWLVTPIRQYLQTTELIIVPHGILHYLPFAALTDGHNYFGDRHTIYYLPSASTLPSLRRRIHPGSNRVLAIAQAQAGGLPGLRFVDKEATNVARLYQTKPQLTNSTTKADFLKQTGAYKIIHIAAHAELKASTPLFSRIRLSADKNEDGFLQVREIYTMDLSGTNLVSLSACQTQVGTNLASLSACQTQVRTQSRGDDIIALSRAFLYAGASSVLASLWTVNDEATSLLMNVFYTRLKQGMSKAAALQAAQIATRRKYPNPYHWAAFVLTAAPDGGK